MILLVLVLVIIIIAQNIVLTNYTKSYVNNAISGKATNGSASGEVLICVNTPVVLNISNCSNSSTEEVAYYCTINATHPLEGANITFYDEPLSEYSNYTSLMTLDLFDIENESISFTPLDNETGQYVFNISAQDDVGCGNSIVSEFLPVYIENTNDAPYLSRPISNISMEQDIIYVPFDLDNHFTDPDGDLMTFSFNMTYIGSYNGDLSVEIKATNQVEFNPSPEYCGESEFVFIANDTYGNSGNSGIINVEVVCSDNPDETETPPQEAQQSASGSGGGSSGNMVSSLTDTCKPEYFCYDWAPCMYVSSVNQVKNRTDIVNISIGNNSMTYILWKGDDEVYPEEYDRQLLYKGFTVRECVDTRECSKGITDTKFYTKPCTYQANCYDGIKNGGEEGVDCGGPCLPCGSCFDGVMNRFETGVDCGGSECPPCETCDDGVLNNEEEQIDCGGPFCPPCPSCFDGVKNQGEIGVDCGGPCLPCKEIDLPGMIIPGSRALNILFWSIVLVVVGCSVLGIVFRKQIAYAAHLISEMLLPPNANVLITLEARERILEELDDIERHIDVSSSSELSERLSRVSREYFKVAFDLDYEFTYDELIREIQHSKIMQELKHILSLYFKRAILIEFGGRSISKIQLQTLVDESRVIVYQTSALTKEEKEMQHKELFQRPIPITIPLSDKVYLMISNANIALNFGKINVAYSIYLQAVELYEQFNEDTKAIMYNDIARLYYEIVFTKKNKRVIE